MENFESRKLMLHNCDMMVNEMGSKFAKIVNPIYKELTENFCNFNVISDEQEKIEFRLNENKASLQWYKDLLKPFLEGTQWEKICAFATITHISLMGNTTLTVQEVAQRIQNLVPHIHRDEETIKTNKTILESTHKKFLECAEKIKQIYNTYKDQNVVIVVLKT